MNWWPWLPVRQAEVHMRSRGPSTHNLQVHYARCVTFDASPTDGTAVVASPKDVK